MEDNQIKGLNEIESNWLNLLLPKYTGIQAKASITSQFKNKFNEERYLKVRKALISAIDKYYGHKVNPKLKEDNHTDSTIKPEEDTQTKITDPNKDYFNKLWMEIDRGFNALKKEYIVTHGFCITRPSLQSSTFIAYFDPNMKKLENVIQNLFSNPDYNEERFKIAMIDFESVEKSIKEEIEPVKKELRLMDPFDRLVDKFIRLISDYLSYINKKIIEVKLRMRV